MTSYNTLPSATTATSTFTLTVSKCVGSFSLTAPTNSQYTVKAAQGSQTLVAKDSSTCGYTPTYAFVTAPPSWIKLTGALVSWSTKDITLTPGAN